MEEIKVGMMEIYRKTKAPNELYSGGIGPCTVVGAIYGRKGYMFHGVLELPCTGLEPILTDLRKDVKNKKKLQIYVVGGEITDGLPETEIIAIRQAVLERIANSGFKHCVREVRWCRNAYYQTLRLILSGGRAKIEEDIYLESLDEYMWD